MTGTEQTRYEPNAIVVREQILPSLDSEMLTPRQVVWKNIDNVHAKLKGLSALEHVSWFYLAQGTVYIKESGKWKEVSHSFGEYCTEFLGRKEGYVNRAIGFLQWIEENAPKTYKVIPRFSTMGTIWIFQEVFSESQGLMDLVFNKGCNDRAELIGAIRKIKGTDYLAARAPQKNKSTRYGGDFNPQHATGPEKSFTLLISRLESLVIDEGAWAGMNDEVKEQLGKKLDVIIKHVVGPRVLPHLVHVYFGVPTPDPSIIEGEKIIDMDITNNGNGTSAQLGETEKEYIESLNPEIVIKEGQIAEILGIDDLAVDEMGLPLKPAGATRYLRLRELVSSITNNGMVKKLESILRAG